MVRARIDRLAVRLVNMKSLSCHRSAASSRSWICTFSCSISSANTGQVAGHRVDRLVTSRRRRDAADRSGQCIACFVQSGPAGRRALFLVGLARSTAWLALVSTGRAGHGVSAAVLVGLPSALLADSEHLGLLVQPAPSEPDRFPFRVPIASARTKRDAVPPLQRCVRSA